MNAASTIVGWVDLAATSALVGGLLYAALVATPSAAGWRALRAAATLLAVALLLAFGLTALRMFQASGLTGVELLVDLLEARWGELWLARSAGLAVLAVFLAGGPSRSWPRASLAAVWLLPRSFQGHAGAHGTVPALVDWLHLLAASTWLGSLLQLTLSPARTRPDMVVRVRALATAALAVLIPAGLYGAFLHVPSLDALGKTPYGRTLIVKLALALALVGLGAFNHFRHAPALARGDDSAGPRLKRNVRLELVIGAGVLLLSALLGVLPMPHHLF